LTRVSDGAQPLLLMAFDYSRMVTQHENRLVRFASCSSKRESVLLVQMVFSTLVPAFEQLRLAPMATLGATMISTTKRGLTTLITSLPFLAMSLVRVNQEQHLGNVRRKGVRPRQSADRSSCCPPGATALVGPIAVVNLALPQMLHGQRHPVSALWREPRYRGLSPITLRSRRLTFFL
jgi:hypothetical protein